MSIEFDKEADAIYLKLKKGKVFKTKARGDCIVDYDKEGDILGLEIIRFSAKLHSTAHSKEAFVLS